MDPFQQTRKRIAPGHGMSPGGLMARQRYYEAEGFPFEMTEFFNETNSEVGEEMPSVGRELDIIAQIKKTPLPMARKKKTRDLGYLCMSVHRHQPGVGTTIKNAGIKLKVKLQQLGGDLVDGLSWILGCCRIDNIIGSLGSASASYFKLLRHLWLLNTLLFLLIFAFISIPQLVHMSEATQTPPGYNDTLTLLVDGRGGDLEFSILFIGYYSGNSTSFLGGSYQLPVVYLVIMFWALVISLLWMLCSSKRLSLAGKVELQESSPFTRRVLASWDFNLNHRSTIQEQQAIVTAELKDLTAETTSQFRKSHWYCCVYLVRFIISCFVCIIMLGGGAAIFFTVQTLKSDTCGIHYLHEPLTDYQSLNFFLSFRVALVVAVVNITFPWIVALLMKVELYSSHQTVVVKSIRILAMYVLSFGVLVYSLLALSGECKCQTLGYCCWETRVGQELYRLFWLDFLLEVAEVMVLDFTRGFFVRFRLMCTLSDRIGYREFDLPKRTLDLLFSQAIVWFGMFFCPQLPVMAVVRFLGMYFLRSWATRLANLPPSHLCFSRANVAYYSSLMLGTLLALMVPLGWTVTQLTPSRTCGPFRGMSHMTQAIEGPLESWAGAEGHLGRLGLLVHGLRSSAVVLPCLFFLCFVVVYYHSKVKAVKTTQKDLLTQLDAECRVSHERLLTAVSLIPPYDPAFYEDEIVGRYNEIIRHNTIHPVQYMGNDSSQQPARGRDTIHDGAFYYDDEAHIPRQVFISEDFNEPLS